MGLREQKQQRTRETIARAAYELFHEQGYDATTVQAIAERAEVAPRTFYRYFPTKDAVLADGGYVIIDRALERIGEPRSVETLVTAMAHVYDELVVGSHFEVYADILRQNPTITDRTPLWREQWSRYLASRLAADQDVEVPTLGHRICSRAAIDIIAVAVDEWLHRSRNGSIADLTDEAVALLRSSLASTGRGDVPGS